MIRSSVVYWTSQALESNLQIADSGPFQAATGYTGKIKGFDRSHTGLGVQDEGYPLTCHAAARLDDRGFWTWVPVGCNKAFCCTSESTQEREQTKEERNDNDMNVFVPSRTKGHDNRIVNTSILFPKQQ